MISLLISLFEAPMMIIGVVLAVGGICGLARCMPRCSLRRCGCVKFWLRKTGKDAFDDTELLIHVHELVNMQGGPGKNVKLKVKLTAGYQEVRTPKTSKGIFQSTVRLLVEQGTDQISVDLITESNVVLGNLMLPVDELLTQCKTEKPKMRDYHLKQKEKGCPLNPCLRITFRAAGDGVDEEEGVGLLAHKDAETTMLMSQELEQASEILTLQHQTKGKQATMHSDEMSRDMQVLLYAAGGEIDVFSRTGRSLKRFLGIVGPPRSRRFYVGIWTTQDDFEEGRDALDEIDIPKIRNIMPDPKQKDVLVISYWNGTKKSNLSCRARSKSVKIWVEMLHLVIATVHDIQSKRKSTLPPGK